MNRVSLKRVPAPITLSKRTNKIRNKDHGPRENQPLESKKEQPQPADKERSPSAADRRRAIVADRGTYHLRRGEITTDKVGRPPEQLRDRLIVRQVLAGNRDRFSLLVDRYRDRILSLSRRMVHDRAEAEDLTQQTFTEAYEALTRFDQRKKFRTWILRIATNNCLDFLKSRRRLEHPTAESGEYPSGMFAGRLDTPEQWLHTTRRLSRALIALEELKPKYRIPVILKDLEGLSYDEMQDVLDLPPGTLRIRVHRGRRQIRDLLARLEGRQER